MWMHGHNLAAEVAENYRDFAAEARGRSRNYEALASAVADDPDILGYLETLPRPKRQPNLLFAAARTLHGGPVEAGQLRDVVRDRRDDLRELMLTRRTQTNEPARCATLLPALAQLPQPLALIEVGASAGLTLLVDRYSYDFAGVRITGLDPLAPTLRCEPRGPVPVPDRVPEIVWRAGLDLNPLDVASEADMDWLACMVWPGESDREQRLADAIGTARRDPPVVHRGDLLTDLPDLAATAPEGATLVVYHTAVLAYLTPAERDRFAAIMRGLPAVWLSNEGPGVISGVPVPPHDGLPFVLGRDGRAAVALTDPHGTWLRWPGPGGW
ncbi:MAG: DUF2332 domain-containing protein [Streptosporangiaceae bacterium]